MPAPWHGQWELHLLDSAKDGQMMTSLVDRRTLPTLKGSKTEMTNLVP